MTRFFALFALFAFACDTSNSGIGAEGDATPAGTNDGAAPVTTPPVNTARSDAGVATSAPPIVSCMAGAMMALLGCADAGSDLGTDSGVLRDSGSSQMMMAKQDAGSSKDTQMPNDTSPIATDAGTSDTAPTGAGGAGGSGGTPGTSDAGAGGSAGSDASPPREITQALVMSVISRLRAIPAGVMFLDNGAKLHVSGRIAVIGKRCDINRLAPLLTGPTGAPKNRGEEAWLPWYGWWTNYAGPNANAGTSITPATPITDAELAQSFPGVNFKINIAPPPNSPVYNFKAFEVISINDWIRANINNLDAAIEAARPTEARDCQL